MTTDWLDSNIDATASDQSGNWTVNPEKSYKICPSIGNCSFNANFSRNFITGEADDYDVTKGTNALYEVYAYAA